MSVPMDVKYSVFVASLFGCVTSLNDTMLDSSKYYFSGLHRHLSKGKLSATRILDFFASTFFLYACNQEYTLDVIQDGDRGVAVYENLHQSCKDGLTLLGIQHY